MLSHEESQYYSRQFILPGWGIETQIRLKSARVLVVGAGALGCAVLQNLCRSGVGKIFICDFDTVSTSNLQRQILFDTTDIGRKKSFVAKEKLTQVNPHIEIYALDKRINRENVLDLLSNAEIIVDGTDNFESKYLLNDACVIAGKPLVSGAIEGFAGQVSVFNYKEGPTYRCLFPETPAKDASPDCNTIGVTCTLPQLIGNLQANEVIKIISDSGEVLSGKMLMADVRNNTYVTFSFDLNPANRKVGLNTETNSEDSCAVSMIEAVSGAELSDARLIDVREEEEHLRFNIGGENIPLYRIDDALDQISSEEIIVTYCDAGLAAKQAALIISSKKKMKVFYLDSPLASFKTSPK